MRLRRLKTILRKIVQPTRQISIKTDNCLDGTNTTQHKENNNMANQNSIIKQARSEIEKSKATRARANKRIVQIKWWSS